MPLGQRAYIQKGDRMIAFRHFIAGNIASDDFGEDGGHGEVNLARNFQNLELHRSIWDVNFRNVACAAA